MKLKRFVRLLDADGMGILVVRMDPVEHSVFP
jgi:hypothetical protein